MHRFFLFEFGIYEEELPEVFIKHGNVSFGKWGLLRHFVYRDILQHMISFILNIEREPFHRLIMDEFSSLLQSKRLVSVLPRGQSLISAHNVITLDGVNGETEPLTVCEKALVLVTFYTKKIPSICPNKCCFRFVTLNEIIGIWDNKCPLSASEERLDISRRNFDKWLSEDATKEHTLWFYANKRLSLKFFET